MEKNINNSIVKDKINYYKELLKDPFPLLKSDIKRVIESDLYNQFIYGGLSNEQIEYIKKEVFKMEMNIKINKNDQLEVLKTKNNINGSKKFIVINHTNKTFQTDWTGWTEIPLSIVNSVITVSSQKELNKRIDQVKLIYKDMNILR